MSQSRERIVIFAAPIILGCVFIIVFAHYALFVSTMKSTSMYPLIATNDIVVASKWFGRGALHVDDLVVVKITAPFGVDLTVRKIGARPNVPANCFYVYAVNTNGLFLVSSNIVPSEDILGKVEYIIR